MLDNLIEFIQHNQFVSGGLVLGSLGAIVAYLRYLPAKVALWLFKKISITFEIWNDTEAFRWIETWINNQDFVNTCQRLRISSKQTYNPSLSDILYIPSSYGGSHWFLYSKNRSRLNRKLLILNRIEENLSQGLEGDKVKREGYRFELVFGTRQDIIDIMKAGRYLYEQNKSDGVNIFTKLHDSWNLLTTKPRRPLHSVILNNNIAENLVKDIQEFQANEQWYNEHGIPYHRGYLLHGPPGNGKTSLIFAVASYLEKDICYMNLNSIMCDEDRLSSIFNKVNKNCLLVLEDIDSVKAVNDRKQENNYNGPPQLKPIDLSSILNVLDGFLSAHGIIVIMTTNYKTKLDPALLRPGRIDREYYLDNANSDMIERLIKELRPDMNIDEVTKFTNTHVGQNMATIQNLLLSKDLYEKHYNSL